MEYFSQSVIIFQKAYAEKTGRYWVTSVDSPNFMAGRKATQMVYGVEPDLTREGGSIPVTLTLEETTGKFPNLAFTIRFLDVLPKS